MPVQQNVSPKAAIVFGLLAAACGVPPILGGLGIIPLHPTPGTPPWVAVAAGAMFVLAGAALVVGYAVAGAGADGNLLPGTPISVQVVQYLLGFGIVGLLTAICGWVAFGPGPRQFSTTVFLPFVTMRPESSERSGRIMFGLADGLMIAMMITLGVAGARRIRRSWIEQSRQQSPDHPMTK